MIEYLTHSSKFDKHVAKSDTFPGALCRAGHTPAGAYRSRWGRGVRRHGVSMLIGTLKHLSVMSRSHGASARWEQRSPAPADPLRRGGRGTDGWKSCDPSSRPDDTGATHPERSPADEARFSPSSKRTRLASSHGDSERSRGGSSNVGRRTGRLEIELRRMRGRFWRREVDRSRFLPQ